MKRLLHFLQTVSGATRGEVLVVVILLLGASLGTILQRLPTGSSPALTDVISAEELRQLLLEQQHGTSKQQHDTAQQQPWRFDATTPHVASSTPRRIGAMARSKPGHTMVHLNTASKTRLMSLPGVGEATADRILQHRARSPFTRPEDLMLVKGIGEKRFERIRPFVSAP